MVADWSFISQPGLLSVIAGLQHDVPQRQREASQELTQVFTKSLGSREAYHKIEKKSSVPAERDREIQRMPNSPKHPCLWQCKVTPQYCKLSSFHSFAHLLGVHYKPGNNYSIVPKLNLPYLFYACEKPLCRWEQALCTTNECAICSSLARGGQEPKILRTSPIRMAADFSFGGLIWQTKPRERHVASPSGWQSHAETCLFYHPLKMWLCTLKAQGSCGSIVTLTCWGVPTRGKQRCIRRGCYVSAWNYCANTHHW